MKECVVEVKGRSELMRVPLHHTLQIQVCMSSAEFLWNTNEERRESPLNVSLHFKEIKRGPVSLSVIRGKYEESVLKKGRSGVDVSEKVGKVRVKCPQGVGVGMGGLGEPWEGKEGGLGKLGKELLRVPYQKLRNSFTRCAVNVRVQHSICYLFLQGRG